MSAAPNDVETAYRAGAKEGAARTIAQTFCLIVGIGLIAAGVLGFIFASSSFETGSTLQREELIIFDVNGWHNVVHIATGAFLVLMAVKVATAAIGALIFGLAYAGVAVWGFLEERDLLEVIPVNDADNWLHVALAALGILVGLTAGALGGAARRQRRGLVGETGRPPRDG